MPIEPEVSGVVKLLPDKLKNDEPEAFVYVSPMLEDRVNYNVPLLSL